MPETDRKTAEAPRPARRQTSGSVSSIATGLQGLAGLLGAGGVAVAAAAAHRGGGDITAIAANMMLIHAAAIFAILASTQHSTSRAVLVGVIAMLIGAVLFSGELALAGLTGERPWPTAAPIGGSLLIAGWLVVGLAMVYRAVMGAAKP
ncbi:DUF423 domain-containing protein [Lichenihabitans psoromatis]|uniref:DUF423 domain-containing protein n=1 Tax=Lichenihabitans psoromatis TaxID=2528642 RepID=UPI00103833D9|nr:DUF423 domain-containing protein [Lichenihabitans psoromatis]